MIIISNNTDKIITDTKGKIITDTKGKILTDTKGKIITDTRKIVLFDLFTQVPGQTTILAGFGSFFYADSCRRYVEI